MSTIRCDNEYHQGLTRNPFAWRVKTRHVGFEVDVSSTTEYGCCRWCGQTLARMVWTQD